MEVPTPKPKPPETYVQQQLIVISLRRKLFLEKQAVVKDELADGWYVKDIQLGVGEKGTTGFMSILLEREVYVTKASPYSSPNFHSWHTTTNEIHYRDPHGLDDVEPYTMEDGEELYTMEDAVRSGGGEPIPPDTEDINEADVRKDNEGDEEIGDDQPHTFNDDGPEGKKNDKEVDS